MARTCSDVRGFLLSVEDSHKSLREIADPKE
jgi:hypothetical protein